VHDRQRSRTESGVVHVEDVVPADILADDLIDREYLEEVFRHPENFLPVRTRPEAEPEPGPEPALAAELESRFARRAKLAGLAFAATLVTVAVMVAGTLTSQHRRPVPVAQGDREEITGAAALGAFAVPGSLNPGNRSGGGVAGDHPTSAVTAPDPLHPGDTTSRPASLPPVPATADGGQEPQQARYDKLAVVKNFYREVAIDPQAALDLLDPGLAAQQPGDLVRAWSSMASVQVEKAELQPDGSVLAVVTMLEPGGSRLQVIQLLRVADDATGLISEARLLSAQHM
jgi:hypothetical protein